MISFINNLDEIDNEDNLIKDIKVILKSYTKLAFLSKLVEFINPEIPYIYYYGGYELKNVDFNVNTYDFMMLYYPKILKDVKIKKKSKKRNHIKLF